MAKKDDDDTIYLDDEDNNDPEDFDPEDRGDNLDDDEDDDEGEEGTEDEDGEESEEEDDDEEKERTSKKNIKIPKYRLEQEIEKVKKLSEREKWLEQQLELLLKKQPETQRQIDKAIEEVDFDFEEAEEKYITLLLEGETKEAVKLRREINAAHDKINNARLDAVREEAAKKSQGAVEERDFQTTVANFESKYDFLNPKKKAYNEEAVDTINTLFAGFLAKGSTKADALTNAVKKVLPLYVKETKDIKSDKRTVDQRKKNVAAQKGQPPKVRSKSIKNVDLDDFDIESLDDKEFSKLAKDRRAMAKLRGDTL